MMTPAIAQGTEQDQDEIQTRRIEVASKGFRIDVPTLWRLVLDERARRFLTINETDEQGRPTGASLNIIRRESTGRPLPQIPDDVRGYAEVMITRIPVDGRDAELISAEAIEHDGYRGIRIDAIHYVNDIALHMTQILLVHPEGYDVFTISMGTREDDRERVHSLLETIYESITLQVESE